jgi:RNA polymerase sigma-70 factor (ECF subfamily)
MVEEASRGEPLAVDALLARHLPTLRAYVRLHADALLRERESCSDLVQSVCREVLENMGSFEYRGEAPFRKWLFAKAMSKIIDRQRYYLRDKRHPRHEQPRRPHKDSMRSQDMAVSFCTPSQVAIGHEDLQRLEGAFDKLPEDYRGVIMQSRLLGLSHAEIAQDMGRSEGAVRVLLTRALARLGLLMNEEGQPR